MTIRDTLNSSTLGIKFMQASYSVTSITILNITLYWISGFISSMLLSVTAHALDAISPLNTPVVYRESKPWLKSSVQSENKQLHELKIQLGKQLFEDSNLSNSGQISCATCHIASMGFSDGRDFSLDNQGNPLPYNTPSIQYVAYNYYFGWTGRFQNLQDHLDALMLNPNLMNRDWAKLSQDLNQNNEYSTSFKDAGYNEISRLSISNAIIQYEYSLARPSRYDLYLLGDEQQLTEKEKQGYFLFKEYGCNSCHQGVNLGGNLRQKFGIMASIFPNTDKIKTRDYGYFTSTQQDEDRFYFRVPSLRNVSNTAPYFHNSSAKTLYQAIEIMFIKQLGISPSDEDLMLIEVFLNTLEPIQ